MTSHVIEESDVGSASDGAKALNETSSFPDAEVTILTKTKFAAASVVGEEVFVESAE